MCVISGQSYLISSFLIYKAQLLGSPTSSPCPKAFIAAIYLRIQISKYRHISDEGTSILFVSTYTLDIKSTLLSLA